MVSWEQSRLLRSILPPGAENGEAAYALMVAMPRFQDARCDGFSFSFQVLRLCWPHEASTKLVSCRA
jgi:hypothetical protein